MDLNNILLNNPELRVERDSYDFNVTTNFGEKIGAEETLERYCQFPGQGKPAHLYFHIPLCSYICHYCNYVKTIYRGKDETVLDRWVAALISESQAYLSRANWLHEAKIESIYFGGGTAALMQERHLAQFMRHIRQNYSLAEDCEISLEGNPDNFQNDEPEKAVKLGFNRFSIGVQSLDDRVTQFVGRKHDRASTLNAIENLRRSGHPFNIDYIFGMPYQSVDSVLTEIRTFIELASPQITIYRLRNADRVKLGLDIANRSSWNSEKSIKRFNEKAPFPSLETTYAMRAALMGLLLENNYHPAPAAWWSRAGTYPDGIAAVSRNKWQNMDTMIAFGPGAYGWIVEPNGEILQTHNTTDISGHLGHMESGLGIPLSHGRYVTGRQAVSVALGYAFKACKPMSVQKIKERFNVDLLKDEPYREVLFTLVDKGFLGFSSQDSIFMPTLAGEAFHEEIIDVYFQGWIGMLNPPLFPSPFRINNSEY
ncbi:MAG: radical SAM protein [Gammaproteobacteria bacterium]|nr:radical SAM protein [Rhodocyclaceae bacterium]MBU3908133.1 radical SAM protein [Gammaproteobacteria bacterium]MBU3989728.1 radical SAM protein [Gammaproteobacteria bacterium]MBU4005774.1 radical SAM protein [Gammaproteobacteria bacterium]MBU4021478.1 radical SAM protein [Gammaproteobacteria bacterium]